MTYKIWMGATLYHKEHDSIQDALESIAKLGVSDNDMSGDELEIRVCPTETCPEPKTCMCTEKDAVTEDPKRCEHDFKVAGIISCTRASDVPAG